MHSIPDYSECGCRTLSKLESRRAARSQRKWRKKVEKYGITALLPPTEQKERAEEKIK